MNGNITNHCARTLGCFTLIKHKEEAGSKFKKPRQQGRQAAAMKTRPEGFKNCSGKDQA